MSYKSQFTGPEIDALLSRVNSYKEYTAMIYQIGTDIPYAEFILVNSFINPVTYSRGGVGNFSIHCQDFTDIQDMHKIVTSFNPLIPSGDISAAGIVTAQNLGLVDIHTGEIIEISIYVETKNLSVSGSQILSTPADNILSEHGSGLLLNIKIYS